MKGLVYDLEKLAGSGKIDTSFIGRYFYDSQEYFDKLTDFTTNYARCLSSYTPAFVVNSEEDKNRFLAECFQVRALFMQLGLASALDELNTMENAIHNQNVKEFADGQVKFAATLNIYMDIINDAIISRIREDGPVEHIATSILTTNRKLLVADSSQRNLNIITSALQPDYQVIGRTSVQSVLLALNMNTPSIFLISVQMPEMSGYELAYIIRSTGLFPYEPIWFLSDPNETDNVRDAMHRDSTVYLPKPVDTENLLRLLARHFI